MGSKIVVIASKLDAAGMNIVSQLPGETLEEIDLVLVEQDIIDAEGVPDSIEPRPDLAIFASRHASESGKPCLTTHFPGNLSEASHGGQSRKVSVAAPHAMKLAMRYLHNLSKDDDFELTVEATHHGPLTDVPCFFVEIGSRSEQWRNQSAGRTIAGVISSMPGYSQESGPVGVGFGGPHYSNGFTKLLLDTDYAISHIVPKHNVPEVDEQMLEYLFERSRPKAEVAILDWKGIRGADRRTLVDMLEALEIEYLRLRRLPSD
jgi:D-aminoacyl-tRNA deacylase